MLIFIYFSPRRAPSEVFGYFIIDIITDVIVGLRRHLHSHSFVQILHQFCVQVLHHLDTLAFHPLVVLVRSLCITLTKVMLYKCAVDVSQLHSFFDPWCIHQLLA